MDRKGETIMGKVIATCTSEIKGVQKKNVHQVCLIEDYGIEGDAHAANGTVRSAFFHMTGFRNSARGGRRSRTARLVKIWSWKESISRRSQIGTKV